MLLRYIASNFDSIAHPVAFYMLPSQENANNILLNSIMTRIGEWKVLFHGVIFDLYASQSPLIKSIEFSRNYIISGSIKSNEDSYQIKSIASFQYIFYFRNEVYEYGFSLDQYQIHEEWLMCMTSSNTLAPLFSRITDEKGNTKVDIEYELASKNIKQRNIAEEVKRHIKKDELFLSRVHNNGIEHIENIFDWFQHLKIHGNCLHIDNDVNVLCDTDCNNSGNGQRIFIADDLSLMDLEHFQQDEIWFANRVRGEFRLRPLSDFKIHNFDILKAYLCGRFG